MSKKESIIKCFLYVTTIVTLYGYSQVESQLMAMEFSQIKSVDDENESEEKTNCTQYMDIKKIAIKFDDGPGEYTDKLLNELEKRNVNIVGYWS